MLENGTNRLLDQVILWNMKLQFVKKKKKKKKEKHQQFLQSVISKAQ